MIDLSAFKAYDIRGRLDDQLNARFASALGTAVAKSLNAQSVVVGHDVRPSSPSLAAALGEGIANTGAHVRALGLCGTEEVYFATDSLGASAGVMVTASHNPISDNGFKIVGPCSRPLSQHEFDLIKEKTGFPVHSTSSVKGSRDYANQRTQYVGRVTQVAGNANLRPLTMVLDAGNGVAGPIAEAILQALPGVKPVVTRLGFEPDPAFPNGIPNPLIAQNRYRTSRAVRRARADFGVAWDGDADRCFFFDETGAFVDGEYVVALIAAAMLVRSPGSAIVHDPRVIWNTLAEIERAGGTAIAAPTGHAFLKAAMRENNAVYGGEMSAHHYFRDFMYCDSGMIPWLLIWALLSESDQSLGDMVAGMRRSFPSSGETNFLVADAKATTARILDRFRDDAISVDTLDGLSVTFADWRFNLRASNTEPLLRLNVESRGDAALVEQKTELIARSIGGKRL